MPFVVAIRSAILAIPLVLFHQCMTFGTEADEGSVVELLRDGKSSYCIVLEPTACPAR